MVPKLGQLISLARDCTPSSAPMHPYIKMTAPLRRRAFLVFMLAVISCTSGCVGIVVPDADYAKIGVSLRNKQEVQAALGEPAKRETSGGTETWFYQLYYSKGLTGNGVKDSFFGLFIVLIPIMHTTEYDYSAKFVFHDDQLAAAFERPDTSHGFICGLFPMHAGFEPVCETEGPSPLVTTKNMQEAHSPCACPDIKIYPLNGLPNTCPAVPKSGQEAACLARQFLLENGATEGMYGVKVFDAVDYYSVLPVYEPDAAKHVFRILRVHRLGMVAGQYFE